MEVLRDMLIMTGVHGAAHVALASLGGLELLLGPDVCKSLNREEEKNVSESSDKRESKIVTPFIKRHQTAQDIVSSSTSVVLCLVYAACAWELKDSYETRVFGTKLVSYWALQQHCGYTLYEVIVYLIFGKELILYVHHALAILNLGNILFFNYNHFIACVMGLVEGTNPCLAAVYAFKRVGKPWVDSPWSTVAGVGLWVGFLVLRIINLPIALYWTTFDFLTLQASGQKPEVQPWYFMGLVSIALIWTLSSYWFYRITLGMLKQLKKISANKSKKST